MQLVRNETTDHNRQRLYRHAIFIVVGANAVLALAKGLIAWMSGSSALFSDAANSLSDTLYGFLMGVGLHLSQQPADTSHPQGHSRFEPFISLLIAAAMASAGVIAVWNSIRRFINEDRIIALGWPTVVLIVGVLTKVVMYVVMSRIGRCAHSPAISASAKDNLADVLATSTALAGIWGSRYFHPLFDPAAGFLVGLWIFRTTWEIVAENFGYLTGRGASKELIGRITEAAQGVPEVRNVHQVIAEYVGPQLRVDMHINLDSDITLDRVHTIEDAVCTSVKSIPEVDLVFVHVEPVET